MIKVKIINIPDLKNCRCGNLFQHYKNFSFRQITGCPVEGCGKVDIVGAHVQKTDPNDKTIYILPLCKEHSESAIELNILPSTKFVLADLIKTCGEGAVTYIDAPVL